MNGCSYCMCCVSVCMAWKVGMMSAARKSRNAMIDLAFIVVHARSNDGAQQSWQKVVTQKLGWAALGGNASIGVDGF